VVRCLPERLLQNTDSRLAEHGADPQVERRQGACREGLPARTGEAEPLSAAPVAGRLRQVRLRQWQVEPEPVQGHQAQRQPDMIVAVLLSQPGGTVSRPAQRPKQAQLVGGTLGVREDEVPQERQGAGPIVRQAEDHGRPGNLRASLEVRRRHRPHHLHAVAARQGLDFGKADRMAAAPVVGTMAQSHHEQAA
jgi:hypothetical protein